MTQSLAARNNAIHRINLYPVDKYWGKQYCAIHRIEIYTVDSAFEQLGPAQLPQAPR